MRPILFGVGGAVMLASLVVFVTTNNEVLALAALVFLVDSVRECGLPPVVVA